MDIQKRKIAYKTKLYKEWAKEQRSKEKQDVVEFQILPNYLAKYHKTYKTIWCTLDEILRVDFYTLWVHLPFDDRCKALKWTCEKLWDENYVKNTKKSSSKKVENST